MPKIPTTMTLKCRRCGIEFTIRPTLGWHDEPVAQVQYYEILCERHARSVVDQIANERLVVKEAALVDEVDAAYR